MPLPWNRRRRPETTDTTETAPARGPAAGVTQTRRGFDPDIPDGGTSIQQQSATRAISRKQDLDELYAAYTACPPASTAIDAIARTITAGGLDVVETDETKEKLQVAKVKPANVQAVEDVLNWVNPYEDARQLMRNVVTDLLVTGDAFIEITWAAGVPAALWHLDSATMIPDADEHGTIRGYIQDCGPSKRQTFTPDEVIHIRFDSPRGGVYGMSPTRKAMPAILTWIWTAALLKETMRKGNPPRFHMSFPQAEDLGEIKRFRDSYGPRHLGPVNIGTPLVSKDAHVQEFKVSAIAEYLTTLDQIEDVIFREYGMPPRKVGKAQPGSLGGAGTDLEADRTLRIITCNPIAELILEKVTFRLMTAYGVDGWRVRFADVDEREELDAEQIAELRVRSGRWTLNRAREEIGEPPVDGGDVPVLVDRQNLVAWTDLPALSRANVKAAELKAEPAEPAAPADGQQDGQAGTVAPVAPTAGKSETVAALHAAYYALLEADDAPDDGPDSLDGLDGLEGLEGLDGSGPVFPPEHDGLTARDAGALIPKEVG